MTPTLARVARQLFPWLGGLALLLTLHSVSAQPAYRHNDANGKVSYSDQPNPGATALSTSPAGVASTVLPYELRQIASRYPVLLYTGDNCTPCTSARNLLLERGIPFTEHSVNSREDIEALQRMSGSSALPLVSIGAQQLKGFSRTEWTQYLDAAAYPKTSQLPPHYRPLPATPLVASKATAAAAPQRPAPPPASVAPRTGTGGIQF